MNPQSFDISGEISPNLVTLLTGIKMATEFQVWFSNRRARLRKQAQSCPPSAYNPMGLPMSYHSSTTPYMDTFSTSAAAAAAQAAQAAHAQVQAAQAAADQYTAAAGLSSSSAYGHSNQTMNPYSASSSLLSSQVRLVRLAPIASCQRTLCNPT